MNKHEEMSYVRGNAMHARNVGTTRTIDRLYVADSVVETSSVLDIPMATLFDQIPRAFGCDSL
ncbi:MAG: hypothetical protein LBH52_03415 [Puniceicoccales bacterium]|nr:hypothetical protein [Puniceicoccales bacterium]